MSEVTECIYRESVADSWRTDCAKTAMAPSSKSSRLSMTNNRMVMPSNDSSSQSSGGASCRESSTDINGNECGEGDSKDYLEDSKESLKRQQSGACDGVCKPENGSGGATTGQLGDCGDCTNCHCKVAPAAKRRCSTSDINFQASDLFTNSMPMKRGVMGSGSAKSIEKIDKINLANLVFNPNFKNSAGCVNLPVIRAGQNLAQKNAQRTALGMSRDTLKDVNSFSSNELSSLNQQAAIDLMAQQLQPHSLNKLSVKLQQLAQQRQLRGSNAELDNNQGDVGDIVHTFTGKTQPPSQSNALRYKTELCRSYEEGGECRFGSACTFAHGSSELRPVPRHPLYKTEFCRTYHQHGYCQYGTRCHFIHDAEEADANAPLKGCKSWGRHDQLSGALLSMASTTGLLEGGNDGQQAPSDNDVLLANLRRLYALRMMNGQEKPENTGNQFSSTQPMGQQLSMAHQQLSSQHLPLSMTQPLPMEALHLGLQQRAGHLNQRPGAAMGHMAPNNRVESLANDYAQWGLAPPSPTYSGLSPFGTYQQFSPLPHHQQQHPQQQSLHPHHQQQHAHHPQQQQSSYPHYPFSATAPDLSAALSMSPYGMSPQNFSNTVNLGHMLPEHRNASYMQGGAAAASKGNVPAGAPTSSATHCAVPNQMWPATSAEVSSVIDKELFGFGLDSQSNYQQQYQHPFLQSLNQQKSVYSSSSGAAESTSMKGHYSSAPSGGKMHSNAEVDLLSLINNSDKYAGSGKDSLKSLRPIPECDDGSDQQGVRPKMRTRKEVQ